MFRRLAAVALMLLCLAAPLAAGAQAYGRGGGGGRGGGYGGHRAYGGPSIGMGARGGFAGGPGPGGFRGYGPPRYGGAPPNLYRGPPGPGPMAGRGPYGAPGRQGWTRGQYLPPEARGTVIEDFERYHLRRPPRGYYWFRAGDNYVLASLATGVIFESIPADDY